MPQYEIVTNDKDFDIFGLEYTEIGGRSYLLTGHEEAGEEIIGKVKLTVRTNKDSLVISADSTTNRLRGCANEFKESGTFSLEENCRGDPSHSFLVSPINTEHVFDVCAKAPFSNWYETKSYCKPITLIPYVAK